MSTGNAGRSNKILQTSGVRWAQRSAHPAIHWGVERSLAHAAHAAAAHTTTTAAEAAHAAAS
ncbi:MAG TPA: hypothetical protein VFA07_15360, partial [Chthonomonadaceae bacterium]|nr:hypothetical protein [Chthonomonadaceae bacterium]